MSEPDTLNGPEEQSWTIAQAAEFLGVHEATIRRRIADGTLPHAKVGALVRVRPEDVRALFKREGE